LRTKAQLNLMMRWTGKGVMEIWRVFLAGFVTGGFVVIVLVYAETRWRDWIRRRN
jgi:hypothetical protein